MKRPQMISVSVILAMMVSGCVSTSKYNAAVAESESIKSDLEKTRAQKNALEQQVKTLKDLNGKLTADAELVSAELQRVKDSRDKEGKAALGRVHELDQKVKDLTAQHKTLRQEYEALKKNNESLKATVARYQKELKERERASSAAVAPALKPPAGTTAEAPAVQPVPQLDVKPPATVSPAAPAPGPAASKPLSAQPAPPAALAPVNINTASANDMVLFLGLTKDVAERVAANRPYRIKGELVAKNIVPKTTFDVIKDRITVGP